MRLTITASAIFLSFACLSAGALADTILGSGAFQSMNPAQTNTFEASNISTKPFWDNKSLDSVNGPSGNIGNFITGTGLFKDDPNSPRENLSYYGNRNGSAVGNATFSNAGGTHVATLEGGITAWSNLDEFGWYDVSDPSDLHVLFNNLSAAPVAFFDPTGDYGFFLRNGQGNYVFLQSDLNPANIAGEQSHQHFSIFSQDPYTYWLGAEDLTGMNRVERNGDFNDMIVRITAPVSATPEPAAVSLFGIGLMALAIVAAKRRRSANGGR